MDNEKKTKLNLKDIKHVYFDMDGTLLNSNKDILKSSLKTIEKLKKMNIDVSIATGRPYYFTKKEINLLKIESPIISCNGALIYSPKLNEIISFNPISKDDSKYIFQTLVENKATFLIYTTKEMFRCKFSKESQWFNWLDDTNNKRPEEEKFEINDINDYKKFKIDTLDVIKFLIIYSEISHENYEHIKKKLYYLKNIYLVQSQENVVDIMPQGSNKGLGLKLLNDKKIIELENTIVFGDADNDISMFKIAKYSVAMGQSKEEVKKEALFITDDNNNDGISKFFDIIIK